MKKRAIKIAVALILAGAALAIRFSPAGDLLSIDNLKRYPDLLKDLVQRHYVWSVACFIGSYIVVVGLSLPGAAILTLAGGFLYGVLPATVYVTGSATTGAVLSFLSARYLFGNWLQHRYQPQLHRFNDEMHRNGPSYLLILRLIPLFPFFLINILAGFTRVPLKTFIWTTSIGIIPGTLVFAFAGKQVLSLRSPGDVLSARMLGVFVLLALFAAVPVLTKRWISARQH